MNYYLDNHGGGMGSTVAVQAVATIPRPEVGINTRAITSTYVTQFVGDIITGLFGSLKKEGE